MATKSAAPQTMAHSLADVFDDATDLVVAKSSIAYSHIKADVAKPMADSYIKRGTAAGALIGLGAFLATAG